MNVSFITANFVAREIGYQGALSVEHEPRDHDPIAGVGMSAAQLRGWL